METGGGRLTAGRAQDWLVTGSKLAGNWLEADWSLAESWLVMSWKLAVHNTGWQLTVHSEQRLAGNWLYMTPEHGLIGIAYTIPSGPPAACKREKAIMKASRFVDGGTPS